MPATTNTFTIGRNPDGDYTNMQAWWNARDGDLVGNNYQEVGQILSGGLTNQALSGTIGTYGPSNFMMITYATNRYSTTNGTGSYVVQTNAEEWTFDVPHVQIVGVGWVDNKTGGDDGIILSTGATNCLIDGVGYVYAAPQPPTGGNARGWIKLDGHNNTIRNCTLINIGSPAGNVTNGVPQAIRINAGSDSNRIHNNTVVGQRGTGINNLGTNSQIWNNISVGCGSADFGLTGANATNAYNLSSDSTATNANSVTSQPVLTTLENPTNGVFNLASGSLAEAVGVDLSVLFTNDYYGSSRDATWDMGAVAIVPAPAVDVDVVGMG